jgi:hypothetical protein
MDDHTSAIPQNWKKKKKETDSNFQPYEFDCEAALRPSGD